MHCCFSEIGSVGAGGCASGGAGRGADCPPPTRSFVFVVFVVFAVFKVNMSSSLGIAAAAALTVCAECVEGGLEFALTIEAQDFIECSGTL